MYKALVNEVKKRIRSPYYTDKELDETRKGAESRTEYEESEFREKNYRRKKKGTTGDALDIRKTNLRSLGI
jgi:hypothetical protein